MGAEVLAAEDVAVFRGERLVFRDVSFVVPSGGALVLAGLAVLIPMSIL